LNTIQVIATLLSLQVGQPQSLGQIDAIEPMDRIWSTGFFKQPVEGSIHLGSTNLSGDGQADLQNHGGPEKAVNVYPIEHYAYWEQTLGMNHLPPAAFGENFTTEGVLETDVCIGDVFEVGTALVQLSQPRQPCWKLARRWRVKDLALRVQNTGRTGWYFRVLKEGLVQAGATLTLIDRPCPEWTVAEANAVMHHRTEDWDAAKSLQACQLLAARWRDTLVKRLSTRSIGNSVPRLYGPND
jgi:MOSC domain-containing protein YiiM